MPCTLAAIAYHTWDNLQGTPLVPTPYESYAATRLASVHVDRSHAMLEVVWRVTYNSVARYWSSITLALSRFPPSSPSPPLHSPLPGALSEGSRTTLFGSSTSVAVFSPITARRTTVEPREGSTTVDDGSDAREKFCLVGSGAVSFIALETKMVRRVKRKHGVCVNATWFYM